MEFDGSSVMGGCWRRYLEVKRCILFRIHNRQFLRCNDLPAVLTSHVNRYVGSGGSIALLDYHQRDSRSRRVDFKISIVRDCGPRCYMRHFDAEGECQQILIESRSGDLDIGDAAIPSVCWNLHSYCQPGAVIYCDLLHGIADRRPTLT